MLDMADHPRMSILSDVQRNHLETDMNKEQIDAPLHTKTLVEQKTDFTAEGSPPPGKVMGGAEPITPNTNPVVHAKRGNTPTARAGGDTAKRITPPARKGPAPLGKYR